MKRAAKIGLAALAGVLGPLVVGWLLLDRIAAAAVEREATAALGVETTLESLRLAFFSGECGMKELRVRNPQGFEGAHFLRLEGGEVAVTLGSLLGDRVVIPRLRLRGIDLSLEQGPPGTNCGIILDNLRKGETAAQTPAPSEGEGRKFLIQEVLIEDIRGSATFGILGGAKKTVGLRIPEIRLRDLGSDSPSGLLLSRVVSEIVKSILTAVVEQGGDLPRELSREMRSKIDELRSAGRQTVESLQEDLKESLQGVEGLFKKKKKD